MIAALAAAGVVGFGSVASAASLGLSTDDVKNAVTGQTSLDEFVTQNTNDNDVNVPPHKGDLVRSLENLRQDVNKGDFTVQKGQVNQGVSQLASAVDRLSGVLRRGNAKLPGGKVDSLKRVTASLDQSATGLRQVPSERVHDAASVNKELSGSLLGLEIAMKRLNQLENHAAPKAGEVASTDHVRREDNVLGKADSVSAAGLHDLLSSQLTQKRLQQVRSAVIGIR